MYNIYNTTEYIFLENSIHFNILIRVNYSYKIMIYNIIIIILANASFTRSILSYIVYSIYASIIYMKWNVSLKIIYVIA